MGGGPGRSETPADHRSIIPLDYTKTLDAAVREQCTWHGMLEITAVIAKSDILDGNEDNVKRTVTSATDYTFEKGI